jgi:hypothetical protein
MGLLDDAIREHLDLRRRRGADPADIERAEREALGPVRRNRESTADDDVLGDAVGYAEVGSAGDGPDESVAGDLVEQADPSRAEYAEPFEPDQPSELPAGDAPVADMEPDSAAEEPPPLEFASGAAESLAAEHPGEDSLPDEPLDDPEARTRVMRAADIPVPDDATAEYDVVEELGDQEPDDGEVEDHQEAEDGEDMLEETPEFLQDTPDHDRLWFEQRPPRDFDFDG